MLRTLSLALLAAFVLALPGLASAQTAPAKYGHMNLGNLLDELPETKKADADLRVFADKLKVQDSTMIAAFQADVKKLQDQYNSIAPVEFEKRKAEMQKRQEQIQAFEADAEKQVNAKRDELLKPILTKLNDAIKAVAKENGYMMIFDTSTGVMLFAAETEDVTALVKKKLGM